MPCYAVAAGGNRRDVVMSPMELHAVVRRLSGDAGPIGARAFPKFPKQYPSQREHWLGWLSEYNGPGYYGRSRYDRDAQYCYEHIQDPGMLLWLAEALGMPKVTVQRAADLALAQAHRNGWCKAVRSVIPWDVILPWIERARIPNRKSSNRRIHAAAWR
jgi:hypothetical protein